MKLHEKNGNGYFFSELWRNFVSSVFTNRILFQRADNGLPWLVSQQPGKCEAANPPVGIW